MGFETIGTQATSSNLMVETVKTLEMALLLSSSGK